MQEEQELLDQLPQLPDLQRAWLLLAMCAAPRANHVLRTVPPMLVAPYAKMHDDVICDTFREFWLSYLLTGWGGLTLCQSSASASRPSPSPAEGGRQSASLDPLQQRERFSKMRAGKRAPSGGPSLKAPALPACGTQTWVIWPHGWQSHVSRIRDLHFRERVFLPTLRSQAGPHAGAWLTAVPIDPVTTLEPHAMQLALRRRLRLPLHLASRRCGPSPRCGAQVNAVSDHAGMPQNRLVSMQGQDLGKGMGAGGQRGSRRGWASGSPAMAGAHNCAQY